jgi:hypothetical protein
MGFPSQVSSFPVTIKATQFWSRYSEARRGRGDALRRVKKAADVAAGLKKSVGKGRFSVNRKSWRGWDV